MHRDPDERAGRADRLRHPGRGRAAAVRRAPRAGAPGPTSTRPRSRCSGCAATATILWMRCRETRAARRRGPAAGAAAPLLRRHRRGTSLIASLRASEDALEDQVPQNDLMQAVASAANEATTLAEVLGHARDLVLLHDDWERARAFVPRPTAAPPSCRSTPASPTARRTGRPARGRRSSPWPSGPTTRGSRSGTTDGSRSPSRSLARRRGATPSSPSPRLPRCGASS